MKSKSKQLLERSELLFVVREWAKQSRKHTHSKGARNEETSVAKEWADEE
jgi:hypothetical protein